MARGMIPRKYTDSHSAETKWRYKDLCLFFRTLAKSDGYDPINPNIMCIDKNGFGLLLLVRLPLHSYIGRGRCGNHATWG